MNEANGIFNATSLNSRRGAKSFCSIAVGTIAPKSARNGVLQGGRICKLQKINMMQRALRPSALVPRGFDVESAVCDGAATVTAVVRLWRYRHTACMGLCIRGITPFLSSFVIPFFCSTCAARPI